MVRGGPAAGKEKEGATKAGFGCLPTGGPSSREAATRLAWRVGRRALPRSGASPTSGAMADPEEQPVSPSPFIFLAAKWEHPYKSLQSGRVAARAGGGGVR
jgi:hypothetical protein